MESTRIQNGQTERIFALMLDSGGSPLTGFGNVLLSIQRISDGYRLDFNDGIFKAGGWTTRQQVMTEVNASLDAGNYYYDFNTSGYSDDTYALRVDCASAANVPQVGELKVGGYVDYIVIMKYLLANKFEWDAANSRFKIYDDNDVLAYYLEVKDKDGSDAIMSGTGPAQRLQKIQAV